MELELNESHTSNVKLRDGPAMEPRESGRQEMSNCVMVRQGRRESPPIEVTRFLPMVQTKLGLTQREGCPQGQLIEDHLHNVEVVVK